MNARAARTINRYASRFQVKPRELKRLWRSMPWRQRGNTREKSIRDLEMLGGANGR